ncbi:MAG: NAD-dependent epimerase/dehydratase family protein [Bacteroidales bacterium]|nr:NAD-dependent epimerase/dehydratase family protein [Bacteroidales bacterium]
MTQKHALLIGATGLVGSHLLKRLLDDERFASVTVLGRRTAGLQHPKLTEHIIDFSKPEAWAPLVQGDVLYLCLGTTRAKAGSKQAQYEVDYSYQFNMATVAVKNGVGSVVLVSSAGARHTSPFFYMRMKGELERDLSTLPFRHKVFIRPGPLTGPRSEDRRAENLGVAVISTINRLGLMKKYKPIHGDTVALAMINATFIQAQDKHIFEYSEVFRLAGV